MNRNQPSRRRPCFEALEDRNCPSGGAYLSGTTLYIDGDAADNEISIVYSGPGDISVQYDGASSHFSDPVEEIIVRARAGDDSVFAEFNPGEFDTDMPRRVTIDLGNGNDQGIVGLYGYLGFSAPLNVDLSGGKGDDFLLTDTVGFILAPYELCVEGGNGNDEMFNFYSGGVVDTMIARTQGGNGDDSVTEEFTAWEVDGTFDGSVYGGNGSDLLIANLGGYAFFDPELPLIVLGFDVLPGGCASYLQTGGTGHDALTTNYVGRVNGTMKIVSQGGSDVDDLFANLDLNAESIGQFEALVRGGKDNDYMEVIVRFFNTVPVEFPGLPGFFIDGLDGYSETPAPLSELAVTANGGHGFDTCLHSALVCLSNVEDHRVI